MHVKKKITITDVAMASGVSKSTVSNYLNNRGANFSADTEKRIRKAISDLRYIPDPGARGIKSLGGGRSIGIMVRDSIDFALTTVYFQRVLPTMCQTLVDNGYRPLIVPESLDTDSDVSYMRELAKGLIAGYLIFGIEEKDDPYVEALEHDGVPYICMGYNAHVRNFVASRHDLGSELAVSHLIERHGASRIVTVPGKSSQNVVRDRIKGYRSALAAHGVEFDENLVVTTKSEHDNVTARLKKLFLSDNPPDSILIPQFKLDKLLTLTNELNIRIPDDLRVVIFDSPMDAAMREYACVQIHLDQVGRFGAQKLVKLLKNSPEGLGGVFLDVDFFPSRSCGCERADAEGAHGLDR